MATWRQLSLDNLRAARHLFAGEGETSHYRSAISRSYYAAYCAVCHRLPVATYPGGRQNPPHRQLNALCRQHLGLSPEKARALRRALYYLRECRETADYRAGLTVNRSMTRDCLSQAARVLSLLEVLTHDQA